MWSNSEACDLNGGREEAGDYWIVSGVVNNLSRKVMTKRRHERFGDQCKKWTQEDYQNKKRASMNGSDSNLVALPELFYLLRRT
jgi:hypothetical protein